MDYLLTPLLFSEAARTSMWFMLCKNLRKIVLSWQEQKQIQFWVGLYNFLTSNSSTELLREALQLHPLPLHMTTETRLQGLPLFSNYFPILCLYPPCTLCNFCRF